MKTFPVEILPLIHGLGLPVDEPSSFTNKHWVAVDQNAEKRVVFIFQSPGNHLTYGEHGHSLHGTWEHIYPDELLICRSDENELFTISFVDETVLALRARGLETYVLLVDAEKFDAYLDSADDVSLYLKKKYGLQAHPETTGKHHASVVLTEAAHPDNFLPEEYPPLLNDLEIIRKELKHVPKEDAAEILLSYCRYHSMPATDVHHNPILAELILNGEVPCGVLEKLFALKKDNPAFLHDLEVFVTAEINKPFEPADRIPGYTINAEGKKVLPGDMHAQQLRISFKDGKQATVWKSDHSGKYFYFDALLEDYIEFNDENECLYSVHELLQA